MRFSPHDFAWQPLHPEPYWLRRFVKWPYTLPIADNDNTRNIYSLEAVRWARGR